MTESELQRKVVKMIKKEFPEVWFYKAADKWTSGIPDLIGCFHGNFFGIELKKLGQKPRPLQEYVMNQIRKAHGFSVWATTVEQCRCFLRDLKIYAESYPMAGGSSGIGIPRVTPTIGIPPAGKEVTT